MLPTVHFHDETVLQTHEIDDEIAEGVLTAELDSGKLAIAQMAPKQALRVGGPAAQISSSILWGHVRKRTTDGWLRGSPLTPALSPMGRGRDMTAFPRPLAGEGGARVSGRVRVFLGLRLRLRRFFLDREVEELVQDLGRVGAGEGVAAAENEAGHAADPGLARAPVLGANRLGLGLGFQEGAGRRAIEAAGRGSVESQSKSSSLPQRLLRMVFRVRHDEVHAAHQSAINAHAVTLLDNRASTPASKS